MRQKPATPAAPQQPQLPDQQAMRAMQALATGAAGARRSEQTMLTGPGGIDPELLNIGRVRPAGSLGGFAYGGNGGNTLLGR